MSAFQVTNVDEIPRQEGAEGSDWYRLRKALDVKAFGVNVYGAEAGKRVIEEHDELGTAAGRHQELYVVLRGRARFQLGADEHTLGHGQMVFVEDPSIRRGAFAEEDGTVVLVVGGTPGEAYAVSAWEAAADAYPYWRAGDISTAVKMLRSVAEEHPNAGTVLYNLSCAEALQGDHDEALGHLARAIALEERFREFARTDEDLDGLRERPEFRELIEEPA